jgi:hypothetical protein
MKNKKRSKSDYIEAAKVIFCVLMIVLIIAASLCYEILKFMAYWQVASGGAQ